MSDADGHMVRLHSVTCLNNLAVVPVTCRTELKQSGCVEEMVSWGQSR
jgi:hypothetical protein